MDWDARHSSVYVETDSKMAKMKQHLNTDSISSKADLLVGRINTGSSVPTQPHTGRPPLHFTCGIHTCCRMANEELSTINQKLHSQAQIIESLTQAVCRLKQEKEQQQQSINHLEGEINHLRHNSPGSFESLLGCRMEELKNELCSLRQHVLHQSDGDCTPDLFSCPGVMQDMLESKKILWQEYKFIKREIDQLRHKLDCHEEKLYNQVSATHEIKRIQNQYCKMLDELINIHKAQVQNFDKTRNETQNTQQELSVVKSTVSNLKEQVKCLSLEDKYTMQPKEDSAHLEKNEELPHEEELSFSFSSDDSISDFSLTDVSSDELFSEAEGVQLADDKVSLKSLKLENIPGEAIDDRLERSETSSELSISLPELNFSDL
ncbi:intermediate filament protein ifp-1-like [Erythrolamprus reginae]|uniref:intermediate filament protein ifp-1-like n=1 Tax=Erythrolamprus reginae TaxID=121349 RepID=UPI00396C495E